MIVDSIKNIEKYLEIPQKVVEFIKNLSAQTPVGHYEITENIYANVDIYETKALENCKFEAHKKYYDIQILLEGTEKLDFISVEGLKVSEAYDVGRDVMFFENPLKYSDSIILEAGKFAFIGTHEAHKPQVAINNIPEKVKKVVVKIMV